MKLEFIKINLDEALLVVQEYDSNDDLTLDFEEFCTFLLPSTNLKAKQRAIDRANENIEIKPEISSQIVKLIANHIERELKFLKKRDEIKRQLLYREDFIKARYFEALSKGKDYISVEDMVEFMISLGKDRPKPDEIEAILRRCDHEGNQTIN